MASFCAMYQNLGEFIKAKGPRKNLWIAESICMKTFFSLFHFPTLGITGRATGVLIHDYLEKVKLSIFTPKREQFLLCMGKKAVKYSDSITKSNFYPIHNTGRHYTAVINQHF